MDGLRFAKPLSFCFMGALALAGCGGGGGGDDGMPEFSSDIGSERTIASVSADERAQICERYEIFVNDRVNRDFICTVAGIYSGALIDGPISRRLETDVSAQIAVSVCEATKSQCAKDPEGFFDRAAPKCPLASLEDLENCGATLGELDRCFDETATAVETAQGVYTCAHAANPAILDELTRFLEGIGDTPTCNSLQLRCPDIFPLK